ncbi:DUF6232 family protein [Chitinophaga silvisoli]|uniref:Uncharacterized protein n=1 Tax=Chitinophaga silvisoli TaxID=2291814 RepID=A0A3E1P384_9BACT|nr:DUF6232 family protein [Chitinophaga silvisoli]RFM34673.1 hypothetical protein DXN04_15525 [Chitinophaga silvisoli]
MRSNSNNPNSPYLGSLIFTNQTLTFYGTTIQLRNVSRFSTHEVIRRKRVTIPAMIIAGIIFLVTFTYKITLLYLVAGAIVGYGIYEYFIPKLYALFIEMNSGSQHVLSSKDKAGIFEVHRRISQAMTSDTPVNTTVTFQSDKIVFGDHINGDKYEANNSTIEKMGSFNNNPEVS